MMAPDSLREPLRYLGFGHSHIVALAQGAHAARDEGAPIHGDFFYLHDPRFDPAISPPQDGDALNPAIAAEIAARGADFLLLSLGGNEHSTLSLVPKPLFDFVAAGESEAPLAPGATLVTEGAVREALRERMADWPRLARAIRSVFAGTIVLAEPPPPLPRHVVIDRIAEFGDGVSPDSVAPDAVRVKTWRVAASFLQALARQLDFLYLPAPTSMIDSLGLLDERAWGGDATHANAAFGRAMVDRALLECAARRPQAQIRGDDIERAGIYAKRT